MAPASTGLTLDAAGAGSRRTHGVRFQWVRDYAEVRDPVVARGGIDVDVVPGMTVPSDLSATIALRSGDPVVAVEAECPGQTRIAPGARCTV